MITPTLPSIRGRIVSLGGANAVRLIRLDGESISYDVGTVATVEGEPVFTVVHPAQGCAAIAGFDPATAEEWPTDEQIAAHIANPPAPVVTEAQVIDLAQRAMDSWAKEWGYDDIGRACTYVGDPYPRFNAEGITLRNARSVVWSYLDTHEGDLSSQMPTEADVVALLATLKPTRPSAPYA